MGLPDEVRDILIEVIDGVGEMADELADADGDIKAVRKLYNKQMRKIRRQTWKKVKPVLEKEDGADYMDDIADAAPFLSLLIRRWL